MITSPSPGKETPDGYPGAEDCAGRQARREVLKRFGRYAAAAPAVMLLLAPREGEARPPSWVPGPPPSAPAGTTRIDRPSAQYCR
jgi:hypothetical protein